MNKVIVVPGLAKLSIPKKIEFARFIVTSMTGNANFTTPSPTLAVINTNTAALETAYIAAKGGGKDETAVMYAREQALDLSLKSLAAYVEGIANANLTNAEAIALSSGFSLKKPPSAPANGFRITAGENHGEVLLRTDSEPRAAFTWQMTQTPDVADSWVMVHSSTKAQYLVTGLESGKHYFFRVAKTDSDGQGPWSNVLDIFAS